MLIFFVSTSIPFAHASNDTAIAPSLASTVVHMLFLPLPSPPFRRRRRLSLLTEKGRSISIRDGPDPSLLPGGCPGESGGLATGGALDQGDGAAGGGSHVAAAAALLRATGGGAEGANRVAQGRR